RRRSESMCVLRDEEGFLLCLPGHFGDLSAHGTGLGYQTAVSELGPSAADTRAAKRAPKAKRPSVAQIATQTAALTEVVAKISTQLAALQQQAAGPPAAQPEPLHSAPKEAPPLDSQARLRQSPVSALVPPYQSVPKSLAAALGAPPPVRRTPDPLPAAQADLDAQMEAAIIEGELPNVQEPGVLASAMMAQSRALLALVGHLAQGGDPVLDSQTSSSSRTAQSRQRLQAELAQLSGVFAEKVRAKAAHRMAPAGINPAEPASLCRYFERPPELSILLTAEQPKAAADALGLLLVYLDQLALDSGSTTVAYLMTLLPDPPQGLFAEGPAPPGGSLQAFTPLADQTWITSALGFLREMDLITTRRAEAKEAAEGGKVGRAEGSSRCRDKVSSADTARAEGSSRCRNNVSSADKACTDACDLGGPALAFDGEFNFSSWAGALPRLVLKTRTAFSHFLFKTLHLQRDEALSVPTALFPLPLPDAFPARSKPRERGGSKRGCGNVRVALHCLVMALNFLHAGFRPPPLDSLRRPPGASHVAVYKRLVGFLRASCRLGVPCPSVLADEALTWLPGAAGAKVPHRASGPDCLRPYRTLDAEGIVLHGSGNWDPTPYLPTSMRLAYLESPDMLLQLLKVWDARSLLQLRRGQNSYECRLEGVSPELPAGFLLTNAVKPCLLLRDFVGTKAFEHYVAWVALFQGDASGVEFATAAHSAFLEGTSDLPSPEKGRIEVPPALLPESAQFTSESPDPPAPSASERMILKARAAYEKAGILGSPEKDTLSEDVFVIGGAQVDSSPASVRAGLVQVGTPIQKRLSLSLASLKLAGYRTTTEELTSMITGAWISALLFRRCAMACLGKLFGISVKEAPGPEGSRLVSLPVLAANIAAPFLQEVFASDASMKKGAYVKTIASHDEASVLWLAADTKGFYTMLDPPARAALASVGAEPLDLVAGPPSVPKPCPDREAPFVPKPIGQRFDFLEHFDVLRLDAYDWLLFMIQASDQERANIAAALVVPLCSKARATPLWRYLCNLDGTAAACKAVPCWASTAGSSKAPIASRLPAALEIALEEAFCSSLRNQAVEPPPRVGLESLLVNDLLAARPWDVSASWVWREAAHINLLETRAYLKTLRDLAKRGDDARFVHVVDSAVTLGSSVKGRSSARTLEKALKQGAALQIAGGLYPAPVFGPTLQTFTPHRPSKDSDRSRQQRRSGNDLPQGRPVLARTRVNRARLLVDFEAWLVERGPGYDAGRPYWIYSETVNGVAARAPAVRRQLQQAWDLGFSWLAIEPYSHHVPLPGILLCAILTACLVWGWVREAGLFALAWGGLLRIGEATNAKRSDLVLPRDVLFTQCFVLLRIQEPKTRLRMARHQAARVEPQGLVELIDLVFHGLRPDERLWPRSQQTLRKRLDAVLARLGITPREGEKALDLGSFRPGGATYLLQQTEDLELTRRRGRWASHKVMEIYLQEVASITFYPQLPLPVREQVLRFAQGFRPTLAKAKQWEARGIPPTAWYSLLLAEG
ncbi:unnamed protein product, partial [Symbiodinium necroappetens]